MPRTTDQIKSPLGVLKIGLVDPPDQDASCQFTHARLVTTPNSQEIPETGCAPAATTYSASSYALEVNYLQDASDSAGIIAWSWANDAEQAYFEFSPFGSGTGTLTVTGQVTVSALPIGGDVGPVLATDNVTWPCVDKPTLTYAATTAAEAGGDESAVA